MAAAAGSSLENVADLISKPPEIYVPQPRYVSKYREEIKSAAKRGKSAHKTLGVPSVTLNPPTEYLKKNSKGFGTRPQVHHEHYRRPGYQHNLPDWQPIKAAAAAADKRAGHGSHSHSIDFTKRNVDEAKNLRASKPRQYYVDDRHGSAHALTASGLVPLYRNRKNFGQAPGDGRGGVSRERNSAIADERGNVRGKNRQEHLNKQREGVKSKIEKLENEDKSKKGKATNDPSGDASQSAEDKLAETTESTKGQIKDSKEQRRSSEKNEEESMASSRAKQPLCRYVTEDERAELLYGMKKKWDEMMKRFQCLPFLTDTAPKAKRKSQMEKDLHQLEKDIQVIERHPYIYVYSDGEEDNS